MKKVLIALSLLAFMPSGALAQLTKRVDLTERRDDCITASIKGVVKRYCVNRPDGTIESLDLMYACDDLGGMNGWVYCEMISDSGNKTLTVVFPD